MSKEQTEVQKVAKKDCGCGCGGSSRVLKSRSVQADSASSMRRSSRSIKSRFLR